MNGKYALQYKKTKVSDISCELNGLLRNTLFLEVVIQKKNQINVEVDCRSIKAFKCKQKSKFSHIIAATKIYSEENVSELLPKSSFMVTHITGFNYFVQWPSWTGFNIQTRIKTEKTQDIFLLSAYN